MIGHLVVALEHDIHEDDANQIVNAIRMFRGVADVTTAPVNPGDYVARTRVRAQLTQKLWEVLQSER